MAGRRRCPPAPDVMAELSVGEAVALVAAHEATSDGARDMQAAAAEVAGEATVQLVRGCATVVGQVVTRKRVSKRLLILNLRQASGAQRVAEASASSAPVFLTVIVKETEVGMAVMDWVRQGPRQVRLGDFLRCTGALEQDPKIGGSHAVLVVQGERGLEALQRFEEQHPGCHWEGHLIDVPSVPCRLSRNMATVNPTPGGDIFDTQSLHGVVTEREGAVRPGPAGIADRYCECCA